MFLRFVLSAPQELPREWLRLLWGVPNHSLDSVFKNHPYEPISEGPITHIWAYIFGPRYSPYKAENITSPGWRFTKHWQKTMVLEPRAPTAYIFIPTKTTQTLPKQVSGTPQQPQPPSPRKHQQRPLEKA